MRQKETEGSAAAHPSPPPPPSPAPPPPAGPQPAAGGTAEPGSASQPPPQGTSVAEEAEWELELVWRPVGQGRLRCQLCDKLAVVYRSQWDWRYGRDATQVFRYCEQHLPASLRVRDGRVERQLKPG